MPRGRPKKTKPKLILKPSQVPKASDLEDYIKEASQVRELTQQAGWAILERDLNVFRDGLARKLAYLNPRRLEYNEARILLLSIDKIFDIVNDYQENRDLAIQMLQKLENPDLVVPLDVDNEIGVNAGQSNDGY